MKEKNEIRAEIKVALAAMDPSEAAGASSAACRNVIEQREFADASSVMIFLPMPGEIDARDIARAAWSRGKRVAVPKTRAPGVMDAVEICSLDTDVSPGKFDILEPDTDKVVPTGELDLIVAPALAFDRQGNRLGRGGGYYDRFIEQSAGSLVCGLAFDSQLLDELPAEPHDRPVNMVATNAEFLRFAAGGKVS